MTGLLLTAALILAAPQERNPDLSNRLHRQAHDQAALLNDDSALVLYRAARDADLNNIPAHYMYVHEAQATLRHPVSDLRADYDTLPDGPVVRCFRVYVGVSGENLPAAYDGLRTLHDSGSGGACPAVLLSRVTRDMKPVDRWRQDRLDHLQRAVEAVPDLEDVQAAWAFALADRGQVERAERFLRDAAARPGTFPITRLRNDLRRAGMMRQRGDTVGAEALRAAVQAAVDRDGRPGLRIQYLRQLENLVDAANVPGSSLDDLRRQQAELAQAHGAWRWEWAARYSLAMRLTDRAEPLAALGHYQRLAEIADSVDLPRYQVQLYYKRGRALRSLGRFEQAERDLERAVEAGLQTESDYFLAEAYHNLFHLNDDHGRLTEAARAIQHFESAVQPLRHSALRMTAALDAAEFFRKAGQHAASRQAYERMVGVVDDFDEYHRYAGEYYEGIGSLDRARFYYEQGIAAAERSAVDLGSESFAGLARVLLATGRLDSAEVVARRHDEAIVGSTDTPLLPEIMVRNGQEEEALRIAREWVKHRYVGGAVRGQCAANLFLAALALRVGKPSLAVEPLTLADSLARSANLPQEAQKAMRLRGEALAALGDSSAALGLLARAAARAVELGSRNDVRDAHVALGRVQAAAGNSVEALAAFDVAARTVEESATSLSTDFDQVGYRAANLAPFDEAIRTLLRSPTGPGQATDLLFWSARRKSAVLAGSVPERRTATVSGLKGLRGVVEPGGALIDYVISGDTLAALVAIGNEASLRVLPITTSEASELTARMREPLKSGPGGRIDLARAGFDTAAAHALYGGLWQPLIGQLAGAIRTTVVPDGFLHLVPFAALLVSEADTISPAVFLVDRFEITYAPSNTPFGLHSREAGRGGMHSMRLLVVAQNAPGVEEEVRQIEATWPRGAVRVMRADRLTEASVRSAAEAYDIVHYATHAVAADSDPLASYIQLRGDAESDGMYHLTEIVEDRQAHEMVVLSGCETQVGRLYGGEGLMSLAWAFMAAGAHSVVATQWPVGPDTGALMGSFYRELALGDSPAAALRTAQLELRSRPGTEHPFYWGGFSYVTAH